MSEERFASVWDAIEGSPAAAENLRLRSALMIALKEQIERQSWTQAEAARRFGVTQPRVPAPARIGCPSKDAEPGVRALRDGR